MLFLRWRTSSDLYKDEDIKTADNISWKKPDAIYERPLTVRSRNIFQVKRKSVYKVDNRGKLKISFIQKNKVRRTGPAGIQQELAESIAQPKDYIQPWLRNKISAKRNLEGESRNKIINKALQQIEGVLPYSKPTPPRATRVDPDGSPLLSQFQHSLHSKANSTPIQISKTSNTSQSSQHFQVRSLYTLPSDERKFNSTFKNAAKFTSSLNAPQLSKIPFQKPNQIPGGSGPISGILTTKIKTRTSGGRGEGGTYIPDSQ